MDGSWYDIWRIAAEEAVFPMALADSDGNVQAVNTAFSDLVGLLSCEIRLEKLFRPADGFKGLLDILSCKNDCHGQKIEGVVDTIDGELEGVLEVTPVRICDGSTGLFSLKFTESFACKRGYSTVSRYVLRSIIECLEAGLFIKNKDRKYTFVSDKFCSIVGLPEKCIIGKRYEDIFDDDRVDTIAENDRAVLNGEAIHWKYTRVQEGRDYIFNVSKAPLRDASGRITGVIGVSRDITSQTRLALDLVNAQRAEALMRLAADIAHDFNNLIYGITGYVTMAMASLDEDHPAYADLLEVVSVTELAGEYTRKLQTLGRHVPADLKRESIEEILEGLENLLETTIPDNIVIDMILRPSEIPLVIDRGRIERALLNICINARDAMPEGGTLILEAGPFEVEPAEPGTVSDVIPGRYYRISISDSGEGMTDEVKERAFEPFFTTKTSSGSPGLGLSIAFGIVKDHKGTIRLTTEPGEGSTLEVLLPVMSEPVSRSGSQTVEESDERHETVAVEEKMSGTKS